MADSESARKERLKPLLDEVVQLRKDLTEAANWLAGNWPLDLPVPYVSAAPPLAKCVSFMAHCRTVGEFGDAASLLGGEVEEVPAQSGLGPWRKSRRAFGERVQIEVWINVGEQS